jgi:Ras-related protein Rab-1A
MRAAIFKSKKQRQKEEEEKQKHKKAVDAYRKTFSDRVIKTRMESNPLAIAIPSNPTNPTNTKLSTCHAVSNLPTFAPTTSTSTTLTSNAPQTKPEYTYLYKIILLGDSGAGKSTFLLSLNPTYTFSNTYIATTIVDFECKTVKYKKDQINLHLWDTAGQERFRPVMYSYYRTAACAILFFDITDRSTFLSLPAWMQEMEKRIDLDNIILFLIGNKTDKISESKPRAVSQMEIDQYASDNKLIYIEHTNTVPNASNELLSRIAKHIYDNMHIPKQGVSKYRTQNLTLDKYKINAENIYDGTVFLDTHMREPRNCCMF